MDTCGCLIPITTCGGATRCISDDRKHIRISVTVKQNLVAHPPRRGLDVDFPLGISLTAYTADRHRRLSGGLSTLRKDSTVESLILPRGEFIYMDERCQRSNKISRIADGK